MEGRSSYLTGSLGSLSQVCDLIHVLYSGGKWESQHMTRGQVETHLADDQLAQDKSVRALIANYNSKRPLALLIDDKYALFPFNLSASGITYAVLGFYFISGYWGELGYVRLISTLTSFHSGIPESIKRERSRCQV